MPRSEPIQWLDQGISKRTRLSVKLAGWATPHREHHVLLFCTLFACVFVENNYGVKMEYTETKRTQRPQTAKPAAKHSDLDVKKLLTPDAYEKAAGAEIHRELIDERGYRHRGALLRLMLEKLALLREAFRDFDAPRMQQGIPSSAAIQAHDGGSGYWLAQSATEPFLGMLRVGYFDNLRGFTIYERAEKGTISFLKIPDSWSFWPCDASGNKVRWPTDANGQML